MALFWTRKHLISSGNPLLMRIQAQKIKNEGIHPVYVFDIEDDIILSPACMITFSQACILPGVEMDLANHPFVNARSVSNPDLDLCLHSPDHIDVGIFSSDICDRWINDRNHPWNGAPLPNGQYTRYFQRPLGAVPGNLIASNNVTIPINTSGNLGSPVAGIAAGNNIISVKSKILGAWNDVPITITITDPKECSCPSRDLFHKGCTCGALSKKKWGLQ